MKTGKLYASLVGPLMGVYYPLPTDKESEARVMLSTSKLAKLWCSIYTEEEVDAMSHPAKVKLPWALRHALDYDSFAVDEERKNPTVEIRQVRIGPVE